MKKETEKTSVKSPLSQAQNKGERASQVPARPKPPKK